MSSQRLASLLIAVALAGGVVVGIPATAQAESQPLPVVPSCPWYNDVLESNQFQSAICWLSGYGITKGTGNGSTYSPMKPVTRASMAAFLYRLAGSPKWSPPTESPFVDVKTTDQFYSAITWLQAERITYGVKVGDRLYFQPGNAVNRGSMAAFLRRLAGNPPGPDTVPFTDVPASHQFRESIAWLSAKKVTVGVTVHGQLLYQPSNPVTRASMAAFLKRLAVYRLHCSTYPNGIGCSPDGAPQPVQEPKPTKKDKPASEWSSAWAATRSASAVARVKADNPDNPIIQLLADQVGKPYKFHTQGPNTFDCSGLVNYAYMTVYGKELPINNPGAMGRSGTPIAWKDILPGDLIYSDTHMTTYVGNGLVIEAASTKTGVIINNAGYWKARGYKVSRIT